MMRVASFWCLVVLSRVCYFRFQLTLLVSLVPLVWFAGFGLLFACVVGCDLGLCLLVCVLRGYGFVLG